MLIRHAGRCRMQGGAVGIGRAGRGRTECRHWTEDRTFVLLLCVCVRSLGKRAGGDSGGAVHGHISLPESRKVALEAFGVSPPYGAPRGPELAPAARGVGMGPRLKTPSTQFTYFDVHAHTDTPQTGPSAV